MSGPQFSANVVAGGKNALADATATLGTSMNNFFTSEYFAMFIGFALVVGFIHYLFIGRFTKPIDMSYKGETKSSKRGAKAGGVIAAIITGTGGF